MAAKLFLDDIRPCPAGYILVRNYTDCVTLLEHGIFDIVSLDYSLGSYQTGLTVLRWLAEHREHLPKKISIHSTHSYGISQMRAFIKSHLSEVELIEPEFHRNY